MRTPWLATLGAVFPGTFAPRWRAPVATPPRAIAEHAATAPTTAVVTADVSRTVPGPGRNGRARDPDFLCVVPYLPIDDWRQHRRSHPRIVSPFRAFPRRTTDLLDLMHPADPRD